MNAADATTWQVRARKTTGASHVRADLENQDSIGWLPPERQGSGVAVTVADGHGSATSFRSSVGSELAVRVSHELAQELLAFAPQGADRSMAKRRLEEHAGQQLVRRWRKEVEADLAERPFSAQEWTLLEEQAGPGARQRVEEDPYLAYGSTLVTAVATDDFMAFWQIGDGDIVVVDAEGRASRPLRGDPELLGNATTSLCLPNAWQYFRSALSGTPAALILASTDGLANSYETDADFLAFGSDMLGRIAEDGLDAVDQRLPEWLATISEKGSGDDVALGILYRRAEAPAETAGEALPEQADGGREQ